MADVKGTGSWPRENEAREYLEKHKILELFDNMTSQLIYYKPDEPKEFLVETLGKLQQARTTRLDLPCLFDESNIKSVFGMLDPTGTGHITKEQYNQALITLGISNYDESPSGADVNRISQEAFTREAKAGLTRMSATFMEKKQGKKIN